MMRTAEALKKTSEKLDLPVVFKSSFMKDNRSSVDFYTGPGLDEGLKMLQRIKTDFELPIVSDVHFPSQVKAAGEVLDIIQIPAYLCMQTTLVVEAAKTGKNSQPQTWSVYFSQKHDQACGKSGINRKQGHTLDRTRIRVWLQRPNCGPQKFLRSFRNGIPCNFRHHTLHQKVWNTKRGPFRWFTRIPTNSCTIRSGSWNRRAFYRSSPRPKKCVV